MDGVSRTLTHWYDANGNRTGLTHADGAFFGHAYDGLDRFGYSMDAASAFPVQHAYNNRQLYALVYGSGYGVNYAYDGLDRPTGANHTEAGTAADVAFTYARNPASQIAALTRDNDAFAWVGHGSGSQAYAVNGLNQYTSIAGAAQSHDANGNLTGDGASSFTYDVENRLIAATGALTASLAYDPLGRLYQVSSGTSMRRFLYDRDAMVAEYDASGTMLRRYLHGPGVDDPLAWYEGAGLTDRRALHADERGSIIAITDASGNGLAINAYDEYGKPQTRPIANGTPGAVTQNALTGTFGYTGQIWLPEIKAYYYKARMYDPAKGRFYQIDPIGYEGGNNLYAYTGNDPINATDPEGTEVFWKDDDGRRRQGWRQTKTTVSQVPSKSQSQRSNRSDAGSTVVGMVANAQNLIAGAAAQQPEARGTAGVKLLNGYGAGLNAMSAGLDAKSQIERGKPADRAIANAGGRAAGTTAAGAAAISLAPKTGGLSIVLGVAVSAIVDMVAGERLGSTAERAWQSIKDVKYTHTESLPCNINSC